MTTCTRCTTGSKNHECICTRRCTSRFCTAWPPLSRILLRLLILIAAILLGLYGLLAGCSYILTQTIT